MLVYFNRWGKTHVLHQGPVTGTVADAITAANTAAEHYKKKAHL